MLLVICRPRGREDVPFRSIALRGYQSYGADAADKVQKTLDLISLIAKSRHRLEPVV